MVPQVQPPRVQTGNRQQTADDRVNYLLSDYDRVTKSLESAKRQLRLHKVSYLASIAILLLDSWFSFNVLKRCRRLAADGDWPNVADCRNAVAGEHGYL